MTRDKKLLTYLMIMQKLDLKPFTNQNKIRSEAIYKSKQNETKETGLKILSPK